MKVSEYILNCISFLEVKDIFLLPGGGAMHLNDALAKNVMLKAIPMQHEQACGIAAESYGRIKECGFGVAMVTTGPGSTNIITPISGAWIESIPLLVLSGQAKSTDLIGDKKIRQGGVQEVDFISMVKKISKFSKTLKKVAEVESALVDAILAMLLGRKGPAILDIPLDIQASEISISPKKTVEIIKDKLQASLANQSNLSQKNQQKITSLFKESRRPLVLVGHGVRLSNAQKELIDFVSKHRIPCVFTWNASDLLEWDNELNIGKPGVVASRAPNFAIQNCDLLISIGCRLDNVITAYNPKNFARNAKKVIVDIDRAELEKNNFNNSLNVLMDAKDFLITIQNLNTQFNNNLQWNRQCMDWKKRYGKIIQNNSEANQIGHYDFINILSDLIPNDAVVITGSSGLAIEVFYSAYRNKPGQRFFLTSGLGSMGYGLPAAIGGCIANNRQITFCIESDGSLMLNIQELSTVSSQELPLKIIVLNNRGYASIRNTQNNYFDGRLIASNDETGVHIPDLKVLAASFGIKGYTVTSLDRFIEVFNTEINSIEPVLIDVHLTESEILQPKVAAIPHKDGSMTSMPLEDMTPLLPIDILEKEMLTGVQKVSYDARTQE